MAWVPGPGPDCHWRDAEIYATPGTTHLRRRLARASH